MMEKSVIATDTFFFLERIQKDTVDDRYIGIGDDEQPGGHKIWI